MKIIELERLKNVYESYQESNIETCSREVLNVLCDMVDVSILAGAYRELNEDLVKIVGFYFYGAPHILFNQAWFLIGLLDSLYCYTAYIDKKVLNDLYWYCYNEIKYKNLYQEDELRDIFDQYKFYCR
jgi:hypothetical protein